MRLHHNNTIQAIVTLLNLLQWLWPSPHENKKQNKKIYFITKDCIPHARLFDSHAVTSRL